MTPISLTADRAGERADSFLARSLPELTRSAAQRLLEEGRVTRNGLPVRKNDRPAPGDVLVVSPPPSTSSPRTSPWTWCTRTGT